ncbi:hypothetical protein B0H13DRAFT_2312409 [Mycena leptocephala]|nr:hypothetical protein B0H13DRAFT_2312409 [Mycena leptocephala]
MLRLRQSSSESRGPSAASPPSCAATSASQTSIHPAIYDNCPHIHGRATPHFPKLGEELPGELPEAINVLLVFWRTTTLPRRFTPSDQRLHDAERCFSRYCSARLRRRRPTLQLHPLPFVALEHPETVLRNCACTIGTVVFLVFAARPSSADGACLHLLAHHAANGYESPLRAGGSQDLNIYTVGFASGSGAGLLGYATLPYDFALNPEDDGVVIQYSSAQRRIITSGAYIPFAFPAHSSLEIKRRTGRLLCACSARARHAIIDCLSPLNSKASPASGCPTGIDPVPENFMDYSYDSCMTGCTGAFSDGDLSHKPIGLPSDIPIPFAYLHVLV